MRETQPVNTSAGTPVVPEDGPKHEAVPDSTPKASTAAAASEVVQGKEMKPTQSLAPEVLQRLARQVEYYFSVNNLSKDTYLSTLRSLNDGFVPLSILVNFAKIQSIVPFYECDSLAAVKLAVAEHSALLSVATIDTQTGKRCNENEESSTILEAVGPVDGEAIPMDKLVRLPTPSNTSQAGRSVTPPSGRVTAPPSSPAVQNTIILREAPSQVEETEIRELFEDAPAIVDLHPDVADCW